MKNETRIDIKEFSKYLIHYFNSLGEPITNKKLQKLLYYVQAWHLVYFDKNILFEEQPEAWVHGPVYPSVYESFKKFKAKPISFNEEMSRQDLKSYLSKFELSEDQVGFLNAVINNYGSKSALELELLTHREKPWVAARKDLADFDVSTERIDLDTMYDYYSDLKSRKSK